MYSPVLPGAFSIGFSFDLLKLNADPEHMDNPLLLAMKIMSIEHYAIWFEITAGTHTYEAKKHR